MSDSGFAELSEQLQHSSLPCLLENSRLIKLCLLKALDLKLGNEQGQWDNFPYKKNFPGLVMYVLRRFILPMRFG